MYNDYCRRSTDRNVRAKSVRKGEATTSGK